MKSAYNKTILTTYTILKYLVLTIYMIVTANKFKLYDIYERSVLTTENFSPDFSDALL